MEQAIEPVGGQIEPSRQVLVETTPHVTPGFVLAVFDGRLVYDGRFEGIPQPVISRVGTLLIMHPIMKQKIDNRIAKKAGHA